MEHLRSVLLTIGVLSLVAVLPRGGGAHAASITLVSPPASIGVGDVFDVAIEVQAAGEIDGAAAYVDVDPDVLELVSVTPGTALPTVLQNRLDALSGELDFVAGTLSIRPSGTVTLATLRLRALTPSVGATLALQSDAPRRSDVTLAGASLAPDLIDGSVQINATGTPVTMAVLAPTAAVRVGNTFEVTIEVRAGNKVVDAAAAYLDFDPSVVQVVSIAGGAALPQAIESSSDNSTGRLSYAAGAFGPFPGGTFVLATVRFRALAAALDTALVLDDETPRVSDVAFGGRSLGVVRQGAVMDVVDSEAIASLSIQPTEVSVVAGDRFDVALLVDSGAQPVDGAAAYLDFDPTVLQVVSVTPGTALSIDIANQIDNANGRIDFVAGEFVRPPSGTFTLASIRFRTTTAHPGTTLAFASQLPRQTDLSYGGASVLQSFAGATVVVDPTSLGVSLSLHAEPPVVSAGDTFEIVARVSSGTQPLDAGAAYLTFDPSIIQIQSLTPGTPLDTVIQSQFDNALGRIDFAAGDFDTSASGQFELLRVRARALRAASTVVTLDATAGRLSDLTFAGESVLTERNDLSLIVASSGVDLGLVPSQPSITVGATLDVAIQVQAGAKQVDGAAAYLQLDPMVFEVLSVTPGTHLPQVILQRVDALNGRVDLVQGTFGNFPSGTFTLGVVHLRARATSAASELTFTDQEPRRSDVTFAGLSILSVAAPRAVQVRGGEVEFALIPPPGLVAAGDVFPVGVEVRAGTQVVDGVSAYLDFDPADFEIVGIVPGTSLPDEIQSNTGVGTLDFAAGAFAALPMGTFSAATVQVRALRAGMLPLSFHAAAPRKTDVTFAGTSVLQGAEGIVIEVGMAPTPTPTATPGVGTAMLNGSVTLQGRALPPNAAWSIPLRLDLAATGAGPDYSVTPTTDLSGSFVVAGLAEGEYTATIKNRHTLSNVRTVTIDSGANIIDFGTLREGDASDDDCINLTDFSILVAPFGRCVGTPGYDDRPDFNEDDCVVLTDFSLLATNFSQCGDAFGAGGGGQVGSAAAVGGEVAVDDVVMAAVPRRRRVEVGETFSLQVWVRSRSHGVDGVAAYPRFDPARLELIGASAGDTLPLILQHESDGVRGTAALAFGTLEEPPRGTFVLATLTFRAKSEGTTEVTFDTVIPRESDATYRGRSVLRRARGAVVAAASSRATPTPIAVVGDCNDDTRVSVNEIVLGVRIALEMDAVGACPTLDVNADNLVRVDELVAAVASALR